MKIADILKVLDNLDLPTQAVSDWKNTNHYELSGYVDGEWQQAWVQLDDVFPSYVTMPCDTEFGRKVGAVMDAAAITPEMAVKLREVVELMPDIIEPLEFRLAQMKLMHMCDERYDDIYALEDLTAKLKKWMEE